MRHCICTPVRVAPSNKAGGYVYTRIYIYIHLLMRSIHGSLAGVLFFVETVLVTQLSTAYPNVKFILI